MSQPSIDSLEPSIGSAQDYQEQQEAQELGNYGIVQAPAVIVGAPAGLYYLPGTSIPALRVLLPRGRCRRHRPWMPQPMQKVVPLPSIVPHGLPANNGSFSGGFAGGFHGGFAGGFTEDLPGVLMEDSHQ